MQVDSFNWIISSTSIEGTVRIAKNCRFDGTLKGELIAAPQTEILLGADSVIEGIIEADSIIIEGFVRGTIKAQSRVLIKPTGRVIGSIDTPNFGIDYGAYFDGSTTMSALEKVTKK